MSEEVDEEIGSWDDPDFTPAPVPKFAADEEDLKDNWDDEDEEEKKEPATSSDAQDNKPKSKKVKGASKSKKPAKEAEFQEPEAKELTGREKEELARQRDLEMMGELFGTEKEDGMFAFQTEQDAKDCANKIGTKLKGLHESDYYKTFLSDLFYKLSQDLDAVSVRKLAHELTALGNDIQQRTIAKKQGPKKKGPQIKANKGDILGDVIDADFADEAGGYGDDVEDFM